MAFGNLRSAAPKRRASRKTIDPDSLPNSAGLGSHHWGSLLATEALGKLRQIRQHGIGAVLVGSVRVPLRLAAQLLWARLRTPLLRIGNPEALIGRVAIGLHIHVKVRDLGLVEPCQPRQPQ